MDIKKITEELDNASLFELYRLGAEISDRLDDPIRLLEVKRRFSLGQEIEYFDQNENKLFKAKVVKIKRTRIVVKMKMITGYGTFLFMQLILMI